MREQSAWDLLCEVGAAEGIDVSRLVRDAELRQAENEQYRREHYDELRAIEVATMDRKFVYDSAGGVLSAHWEHEPDSCTVCDARRLAMEAADA